ncbi:hypothetical protein LIER_29972 [Lithospermum erythrorhizon]|uniref:Uncharacterized protein n=1 Tax=Lithospermum erythrorhizon TaxID=34254 RepID=A0AAV3RRX9_LITER
MSDALTEEEDRLEWFGDYVHSSVKGGYLLGTDCMFGRLWKTKVAAFVKAMKVISTSSSDAQLQLWCRERFLCILKNFMFPKAGWRKLNG